MTPPRIWGRKTLKRRPPCGGTGQLLHIWGIPLCVFVRVAPHLTCPTRFLHELLIKKTRRFYWRAAENRRRCFSRDLTSWSAWRTQTLNFDLLPFPQASNFFSPSSFSALLNPDLQFLPRMLQHGNTDLIPVCEHTSWSCPCWPRTATMSLSSQR